MLWILNGVDQISYHAVSRFLPSLSAHRRQTVLAMRSEAARVQRVLAELLLHHAVRTEFGLSELPTVQTGEKGKPFFPDSPALHFNLSHCKTAVACAMDSAPLGVDVQELRSLYRSSPGANPSVYRVLSPFERAWVTDGESESEREGRFLAVWTCKEAYGKAIGCGYLYDLKITEFCPHGESWRQYGYSFELGQTPDYVWALCAQVSLPVKTVSASSFLADETRFFAE